MKEPLPKKVHTALRTRIYEGSLPPGTRLDYKQLALELGVSTTPVREAVTQLASEGFVELVPRLGAVVRSLNRTNAQELYEVREALECCATEKASERMSLRQLDQLREQLAAMREGAESLAKAHKAKLEADSLRRFLDADLAFHQTILAGARNQTLTRTLKNSYVQYRIFLADRGSHDPYRIAVSCDQHAAILEALEKRDAAAATKAMREHIRTSLQFTLDYLDTQGVA